MSDDIRWLQRFANYIKALLSLSDAVALADERPLSKLEQQGLIQAFEFTHELAWNVLKDYLDQQGIFALIGSRDASRSAFQNGLITDGEAWMDMIKARNLTSHTYNPEVADSVTRDILVRFYPAFCALRQRLAPLAQPGPAP
jgi:nucleotidyltransferase substrate binding protein (TIGR01987 family)